MLLDSKQKIIEKKLKDLALILESQSQKSFLKKLFNSQNQLKSFYIYGNVGCGKSMLMKGFFDSLHKTSKAYFHFNGFMRLIHEGLRDIRCEEKKFKDELIESLKRAVQKNKVICLDEFQVLDIADAMLLSRIFSYLFLQKIVVVFTSNLAPQNLYQNGLQREVFLQFVERVLLVNCQVLHLDSPIDYRAQNRNNLKKRYLVSNQKNRSEIKKLIQSFTENKKPKALKIKVWGREIKIKKAFEVFLKKQNLNQSLKKIAVLDFNWLCQSNFGAADYQAICKNFDLIFLLKISKLSSEDVSQAKRLMLFIDEIYENKTALIVLAKTKSTQIYQSGIGFEAFKRTISRFGEIKSDQYWQNSKINL
jgi:cell division protein ZapE